MARTCPASTTTHEPAPAVAVPDVAMVFAAGLGTRMRPVTDTIPKSLVEVGGRALIDHMLDRFAAAGVTRAIVNVHYLADRIEDHLRGRTDPAIIISDEREKLLDQGGGIRRVLPLLGDAFFIANTDAIWIENGADMIAALRDAWDPVRMDVLLLVAARRDAVGVDWPGDFHLRDDGRLVRRAEGEEADFVYAGVGIMPASLFAPFTDDVFRLAPLFFDAARNGRLFGLALDGLWLHVGTPAAIGEADEVLAAHRR
jgi:MurNAc alpha-1-phosphate uridylyltransferase